MDPIRVRAGCESLPIRRRTRWWGFLRQPQADGRYAVDFSLVADMVPLPALADQVRERVRKRARGERLEELLGSINVEFAYVVTREELAAAAAEREVEEALGCGEARVGRR